MAESPKGHYETKDLDALHKPIDGDTAHDDGACLTGHEPSYAGFKPKVSCSYRYQAYEWAKPGGQGEINRRLHSYNDKLETLPTHIGTSVYLSRKIELAPVYAAIVHLKPGKGDWDVGGPHSISRGTGRKTVKGQWKVVPIGQNFTNAQWPYWNNAHHVIPKGALKAKILAVEGKSGLIQEALLKAKYNVNYQVNMFLLPQDLQIASILDLCRHLQLKEDDSESEVVEDVMAHSEYSQLVSDKLTPIIDDYKEIVDKAQNEAAKTPHVVPDPKFTKRRLEGLSDYLTKLILKWGKKSPGVSIAKKAAKRMKRGG